MASARGYVVAVAGVVAVAIIRWQLDPFLGSRAPLLLFIIPVLAASLRGGLGPGLLATVLGGLAGGYLFILPHGSLGGDPMVMSLWALVCISVSLLGDRSLRDIEGKKEAERHLIDANERLLLALSAGKQGIWEQDLETGSAAVDSTVKELLDLPGFNLPVHTVIDRIHPEDRERVGSRLATAAAGGEDFDCEFRIALPEGRIRWVAGLARLVHDERGRPKRLLGINYDITERKRLEIEREELLTGERMARREAERANMVKENFLSVLSHELRSPLNSILGWAAILKRKLAHMPDERDAVGVIERNARAQAALIETMLEETRLAEGKVKLDLQPLSLVELAENAVRNAEPLAAPKDIGLSVALPDEGATCVNGDQARLQQVLSNLLSNAIKFTPPHGKVEVTVFQRGNRGGVTVRDSGVGISREALEDIFERFRQVSADSVKHGGLGLGLSICRQIVELHRGRIWAESEGEGRGAAFSFEVPALRSLDEAAREKDLSGIRVLVVDDEPDARDLLRRLLNEFNADVIVASSALEALEIAKKEHPDVMLADLSMPEKDGLGLIRELRELEDDVAKSTPAAVVSALNRREDRLRSEEAGYQGYLTKPVNVAQVVDTVAALASTDRRPSHVSARS